MKEDSLSKRLTDTLTEYSSDKVTSVIPNGFSYQRNLKSVSLPNCKTLSALSFYYCTSLSTLNLPDLVKMEHSAFKFCRSLTEFITTSVFDSRIDTSTFEECTNLKIIDLYHINSLGIGLYAFYKCSNLVTLIIRNTDFVPSLNEKAFGLEGDDTAMNNGEGHIYVPSSMVDAYKQTTNWSKYAEQILSIEELEG